MNWVPTKNLRGAHNVGRDDVSTTIELIQPDELGVERAQEIQDLLEAHGGACVAEIVTDHGRIEIPPALCGVLASVVRQLAQGQSVTVAPAETVLTTSQAADVLNVSRPYLVRLLEQGSIPSFKVGTHHRVRLQDVQTYRLARNERRRAGLDLLAEISPALDLDADD